MHASHCDHPCFQANVVAVPQKSGVPAGAKRTRAAAGRNSAEVLFLKAPDPDSCLNHGPCLERALAGSVDAIRDANPDLVVLGPHSGSMEARAAMAKMARYLLPRMFCPLIVAPYEASKTAKHTAGWRHVLAAIDFSASSLEALEFASRVVESQLTLLHVEPCGESNEDRCCLERLRFLAPLNDAHTVPVDHLVGFGDVATLIVSHAKERHADLIVLGAPFVEASQESLPSSTVYQIIANVTCPVVCVPSTFGPRAHAAAKAAISLC